MIRFACLFVVALAATFVSAPTVAKAGCGCYSYHNNTYHPSDVSYYTWRDGHFWRDGIAFTRAWTRLYINGCYQWAWLYTRVAVQPPLTITVSGGQTTTSITDENWRSKMLDMVKAERLWDAQMAASANEHNEFKEAAVLLGLNKRSYAGHPGLAANIAVVDSASYDHPLYTQAEQGNTLAGYNERLDIYGSLPKSEDIKELYNHALRLRGQSRQFEADGEAGTTALVDNIGMTATAANAQVAEINSKMIGIMGVIDKLDKLAARLEAKDHTIIERTEIGPARRDPSSPAKTIDATTLVGKYCAKCHTESSADRNTWADGKGPQLQLVKFQDAFKHIFSSGAAGQPAQMPPKDSPQPTQDEVKALLIELESIAKQ